MDIIENPKTCNSVTQEERDNFVQRLRLACRKKGMTMSYLQVKIGKTGGYFRNMGFISPKIAPSVKEIIPDLNIDYINTGKGEMFFTNGIKKKDGIVPVLPVSAQGGTLTSFVENKSFYKYETIVTPSVEADLAIRAQDDAMSPEIIPGSILILQRIDEKAFIEWGKTFVLDTRNGILVRKIFPFSSEGEKKIVCGCENPRYAKINVPLDAIFGWYKILLQIR